MKNYNYLKSTIGLFVAASTISLFLFVSMAVAATIKKCPTITNAAYKTAKNPAVYYITTSCTKQVFVNSVAFFQKFSSWKQVKKISQAVLVKIPNNKQFYLYPAAPKPAVITQPKQIDTVAPPAELLSLTPAAWFNAGDKRSATLNAGGTFQLSNETTLRVEKIQPFGSTFSVIVSVWNKSNNSCRLVGDMLELINVDGQSRYAPVLNWFLELSALNAESATINVYSGNQAFTLCAANNNYKRPCLAFPHDGYSTISSGIFSRMYQTGKESTYNNLMLNFQLLSLERIYSVFPSLKKSVPFDGAWKFVTADSNVDEADWALDNTALSTIVPGGIKEKITNDSALRKTYETKLKNKDLNFEFATDMHEWTHLVFYSTELNNYYCRTGKSCELVEGVADYIRYKGLYTQGVAQDAAYANCKVDHFEDKVSGSILNGMTYADAFTKGWKYDAGNCFFKKTEDVCGVAALDNVFAKLLRHTEEPFAAYPSIFKLIQNNCQNPSQFATVMDNFGFSRSLLDETYSLANDYTAQKNACTE